MSQIYGAVEVAFGDNWCDVINVSSLLLQHFDLNACLFGVDNYAGYTPLFPDRGLPEDCALSLRAAVEALGDEECHPSWASWEELQRIDWDERATRRDLRITEFVRESGVEQAVTKSLNVAGMEDVRAALDRDPSADIVVDGRTFRRLVLTRRDSVEDTDFPLLMRLMGCLAERFGGHRVRLTVWFG
jgi:hypothetical protein